MRNNLKSLGLAALGLVLTSVAAMAEPLTPTEQLTAAQTSIDSTWTWVAGIMVAVAVVTVTIRFFKKAR